MGEGGAENKANARGGEVERCRYIKCVCSRWPFGLDEMGLAQQIRFDKMDAI